MGTQGTGIKGNRRRATLVALATLCVWAVLVVSASAAAPAISNVTASEVTSTSAVLRAKVNPQGIATSYHFEYGTENCFAKPNSCVSVPIPNEAIGNGTSAVSVAVPISELTPATVYHLVIEAESAGGKTRSPDRVFATYGTTFEGLPDGRAYEQASPIDKDGGDAVGQQSSVKASIEGDGITFGSTFGMPGGKGAQEFPTFLGTRGEGESGWSTQGLLPPIGSGEETRERARVMGWLPDHSQVFVKVTHLGNPNTEALIAESTVDGTITTMTAYVNRPAFFYAGASSDGSTVLFESRVKLPPKAGSTPIAAAVEGATNLYAWDRASGEVSLAGVFNDETGPAKGSIAGPYDWARGTNGRTLQEGGASSNYYLQDERAITPAGDVYFTTAGTGQLYLRVNPTRPQSDMNGEECLKPEDACTIHVTASRRAVPDPAGEQPAVFQSASADGSKAFFTSPEKLTEDANTGPEQPKAEISRTTSATGGIDTPEFLVKRGVGVAVDSEYIYWADPAGHRIGRAELDGNNADPNFIDIPEGECEEEFFKEGKAEFRPATIPSEPRYVAVDDEHIYWTNTGRRDPIEGPIDGGGTIGRADIDGNAASVDPDFICGTDKNKPGEKIVSNPQGIAVSSTHVYWANAARNAGRRSIGRAAVDGSEVEGEFFSTLGQETPFGLAATATHLYFVTNLEGGNNVGLIDSIPLEGGEEKLRFVGESGLRGVAVDANHVYWVSQKEGAIGRVDLELTEVSKENKFIETEGTVNGLAADATHLYWAVNGESPSNPGNDLYRFEAGAGEPLTDLTPDSTDLNGAEVQAVLGTSEDGSHLYFAANGDLDGAGPAKKGNCKGPVESTKGKCSLYLWSEGQPIRFVAPLDVNNVEPDSLDWVPTPVALFGIGSYFPKMSFISKDGEELLFRSQEKLTAYENEGVPELYLYSASQETISCVSCSPSGEAAGEGPIMRPILFPGSQPPNNIESVSARNLAADGEHVFFESAEALSPADTNGQGGCPSTIQQGVPNCLDVYEWEAPDAPGGSCQEGSPSYNPLNNGCLYLISTGKSKFPSFFGDASESGNDVFFFTRDQLVGQDKDELQDVYDARVGGGLASQEPVPVEQCPSAEACHGPVQTPPSESSPATPGFVGPGNPVPKHKKPKPKKHKAKKHKKQKHKKAQRKAGAKPGRSAR